MVSHTQLRCRHRQLMLIIALCFVLVCSGFTFYGGVVHATTEEETEANSMSLYSISTALSSYFSDAIKPQSSGGVDGLTVIGDNILADGDAGAFAGYGEQDWMSSALSNSSNSASYSSYKAVPTTADDTTASILSYARYGYLLGSLGLDRSTTASTISVGPTITGGITLLLYLLSLAVPACFNALITILKFLNPFALFGLASHTAVGGMTMDSIDSAGPLYGLATVVSGWYDALYSLSWGAIVPIFFAFLVASLLLFKTANKATKIKKYCIRIAFIVIGIPILGTLYTGMLDSVGTMTTTGNTAATRVVASTFCDFESWAVNSRLAAPSNAVLEYTTASTNNEANARPTVDALMSVRESCYNINSYSGAIAGLTVGGSPFATAANTSDTIAQWNTTSIDDTADTNSSSAVRDVVDVLQRYSRGDFYHGSDYESKIKAELSDVSADSADTSSAIFGVLDKATTAKNWAGNDFKTAFTDPGFVGGYNIFHNGGLINTDGVYSDVNTSLSRSEDTLSVLSATPRGLSTMSMFNYLNTSFKSSNMVMYSSEKASSGFVREGHRSVSLVGSGLTSSLYWLNSVLLLGSFIVIGYFYCFTIIFANFRKGIMLIAAIPFAMLGSIRGIAKVLTYSIMLIIEVIVTIFVYGLVTEILMQLPMIIQAPMSAAIGGSGPMSSAFTGNVANILIPVVLLISCVIYIVFTIQAIKLRKVIVKSIDEASADIINKFLDVNNAPNSAQPGMAQKMGGAMASGAGMAAGQKLAGGSSSGSKDSGTKNGSAPGTAKTVATGGGKPDAPTGPDGGNTPTTGDGGVGMAAGAVTGAAFANNNAEQADKDLAQKMTAQKSIASDRATTEKDKKAVREQASADNLTCKTGAVAQEKNADDAKQLAKQQLKDAKKQKLGSSAQMAVGAAEVAAGVYTGNAALAKDGVKNVATGNAGLQEGKDKAKHAGSDTKTAVSSRQTAQNKQVAKVPQGSATQPHIAPQKPSTQTAQSQVSQSTKTAPKQASKTPQQDHATQAPTATQRTAVQAPKRAPQKPSTQTARSPVTQQSKTAQKPTMQAPNTPKKIATKPAINAWTAQGLKYTGK